MNQEEGIIGKAVGTMIRRTVKSRLRNLYWSPPTTDLEPPIIFYVNHHGWLDGYLMFQALTKLDIRFLDWIEEFDAFPLFSKVGGMRFAKGDLIGRAKTVRTTIKKMRGENYSLVLFPEGILHQPPILLPFGRSLEVVAKKVTGLKLVPVAIYYELSMHERPEAWVGFGEPHHFESMTHCENKLQQQLESLRASVGNQDSFEVLTKGTPSVNERMSMKRFRKQ